jgi:subtilase family serine protease
MKNLGKVLAILALVAVIGAPVMAQSLAARLAAAGHPIPVVPTAAAGHNRPFVWVAKTFNSSLKPLSSSLPWFCNIQDGPYWLFCPNGLNTAYSTSQIVGGNGGAGMTIAIVDAYYYANVEADLGVFDSTMLLPACTVANGCFKTVDQRGNVTPGLGGSDTGWELETMLDVEWAHSMAPKAKILLVHSDTSGDDDMAAAVIWAYTSGGASIVSNSYGGSEFVGETTYDYVYSGSPVPVLFASGDGGAPGIYPCASIYATCVGGTSLYVNPTTYVRTSEVGWAGSGGGCSTQEPIPSWQATLGICDTRAYPDVAAIADPDTGVMVYDVGNFGVGYYGLVGGTSLATPVTAALYADMFTARKSFGKTAFGFMNPSLYTAAANNYAYFYYDVLTGNNGFAAGVGYDLVTGLGVSKLPAMANRFFGLVYPPLPSAPPPD